MGKVIEGYSDYTIDTEGRVFDKLLCKYVTKQKDKSGNTVVRLVNSNASITYCTVQALLGKAYPPNRIEQPHSAASAKKHSHALALTAHKVAAIKAALHRGVKVGKLAKQYKVCVNTIVCIEKGKTWVHVDATAMIAKVTLPDSVW
jgi:hypothetical protein